MKKSARKILATLCCIALVGSLMSGCKSSSSSSDSTSKIVNLTAVTNISGVQFDVLKKISDDFATKNPNIKVDFTSPGQDYESILKIKMASQDMPDVFSTHGWAIRRYGNFLLDLKNEPWASKVDSGIKPLVTDSSGKLCVLPMDQLASGCVYNADVFNTYGINAENIKTIADLANACETIKTKSNGTVAPLGIAGGDGWPAGQVYDTLAATAFTTAAVNDSKSLLDGSFDWNKWTTFTTIIQGWVKKGYFNKDVLTLKVTDFAKDLATGKIACVFIGESIVQEALKYNPSFKAGDFPFPAYTAGESSVLIGGENTTFGIWKGSKNIEAAKKYVNNFAQSANIKALCESNQMKAGITGVNVDLGWYNSYIDKYKSVKVVGIFDRTYLPNGMWDMISKDGISLLASTITPDQFSKDMKSEYIRLRAIL